MAGGGDLGSELEVHTVPVGTGELRQVLVADPGMQGEFTLIYQLSTDSSLLVFPEVGEPKALLSFLLSAYETIGDITVNGVAVREFNPPDEEGPGA